MSQQELAGVTLRRTQELIKKGFISAAQLDKDVSAMRTANASLAAAKSRVAEADAKVASLQANLNDLTLKSPVNGRILYRLAEPGEVLPAGGRVFSMLDLNDVYMYIYLSAADSGMSSWEAMPGFCWTRCRICLFPARSPTFPRKTSSPRKKSKPKTNAEKFMFRVKLKVDPDWLAQNATIAKPGMPGIGWVKTNPDAVWPANLQVK